ncbi:MAG TPA: hypothetical protein VGK77_02260, partial [Candidatus Binatia bacterium]
EDRKIFDLGRPKMTARRFYKNGWVSGSYAPARKIPRAARRNYFVGDIAQLAVIKLPGASTQSLPLHKRL